MISLNYRDSRPIYEQIKDGLKKLIVSGAMAADEKLPSVRALATQLSINPNTIQRAYQELERSGYIYTVKGKGSFVCDTQNAVELKRSEQQKELNTYVTKVLATGITEPELTDMLQRAIENAKKEGAK